MPQHTLGVLAQLVIRRQPARVFLAFSNKTLILTKDLKPTRQAVYFLLAFWSKDLARGSKQPLSLFLLESRCGFAPRMDGYRIECLDDPIAADIARESVSDWQALQRLEQRVEVWTTKTLPSTALKFLAGFFWQQSDGFAGVVNHASSKHAPNPPQALNRFIVKARVEDDNIKRLALFAWAIKVVANIHRWGCQDNRLLDGLQSFIFRLRAGDAPRSQSPAGEMAIGSIDLAQRTADDASIQPLLFPGCQTRLLIGNPLLQRVCRQVQFYRRQRGDSLQALAFGWLVLWRDERPAILKETLQKMLQLFSWSS